MGSRVILHSDINCCYAQIECQEHPELRGKPVVVGGDEQARHGIVLAKNMEAKRYNIKTGETLWQARAKCPDLVVVPPNYQLYLRVSAEARRIYYDYTNKVEPFGPDEAWLDVTGSLRCLGMSPYAIACEISERMKAELGISVSVGVSWNKIFAKFASDYKKPDAITVIDRANYRSIVWPAPVQELLYVGSATRKKLNGWGIYTIGELARAPLSLLRQALGKMGEVLSAFARGEDQSEVMPFAPAVHDVLREVKSYGNGITFPRDITDRQTAKAVIWMLSESVAQRARAGRARGRVVSVSVRRARDLVSFGRQMQLPAPSNITSEIAHAAWQLAQDAWPFSQEYPARGISVRISQLSPQDVPVQLSFFDPLASKRASLEQLDQAIDGLRHRFGNNVVVWGPKALDISAHAMDAERDNVVHPVSFFHRAERP